MRILGIDPGTRKTGYALLEAGEQLVPLDWGAITSASSLPIERRLNDIYRQLVELVRYWRPSEVAIEEPFMGKGERRFVGPAFAVGQAQAVALLAAVGEEVPVFRYSPAQVKRAIADYGAATKEQVQNMVALALGMETVPTPIDAADALALCLCHLRQRQVEEVLAKEIPLSGGGLH